VRQKKMKDLFKVKTFEINKKLMVVTAGSRRHETPEFLFLIFNWRRSPRFLNAFCDALRSDNHLTVISPCNLVGESGCDEETV
jgi:hypothetical protein